MADSASRARFRASLAGESNLRFFARNPNRNPEDRAMKPRPREASTRASLAWTRFHRARAVVASTDASREASARSRRRRRERTGADRGTELYTLST